MSPEADEKLLIQNNGNSEKAEEYIPPQLQLHQTQKEIAQSQSQVNQVQVELNHSQTMPHQTKATLEQFKS